MALTTMGKSRAKAPQSSALWDNVKTIVYALALAMTIRFAIAQPFRIPSGSMQPTMLVGDYIAVSKWSYGYGKFSIAPLEALAPGGGRLFAAQPEPGDVVVFRPPSQPHRDYVKRLIGVPGDKIQMVEGVLYINDRQVQREFVEVRLFDDPERGPVELPTYRETLPNGVSYLTFDRASGAPLDTTPAVIVPEGRYFFMGDDRDNSQDSRTPEVGYVPFDHLVGKAQVVVVSYDQSTKIWKPWTWITGLRGDRFWKGLNGSPD